MCSFPSTANPTDFGTLASSPHAIVIGVKGPVSSSETCERDADEVGLEPGEVTFELEPGEAASELGLGDVASEFEPGDSPSRLAPGDVAPKFESPSNVESQVKIESTGTPSAGVGTTMSNRISEAGSKFLFNRTSAASFPEFATVRAKGDGTPKGVDKIQLGHLYISFKNLLNEFDFESCCCPGLEPCCLDFESCCPLVSDLAAPPYSNPAVSPSSSNLAAASNLNLPASRSLLAAVSPLAS